VQLHSSFSSIAYARTQTSWLDFQGIQGQWIDMDVRTGGYRMNSVDPMLHIMKIQSGHHSFSLALLSKLSSATNKTIYYHVASYDNCRRVIDQGIMPGVGRTERDFGLGFYVTTSKELAEMYISGFGDAQLLIFAIPPNHGLLEVTLQDVSWQNFVYNNLYPASGNPAIYNYDLITGAHSSNYFQVINHGFRPTPSMYPQSCLKSAAATNLWSNNLLAIVEFSN